MKRLIVTTLFLALCVLVKGQHEKTIVVDLDADTFDNKKCKYVGVELGGNGEGYSVFAERSILTTQKFALNIKPQLEYIWGSDEDSIPRHLIPILGLNMAFGKPLFHITLGISTAVDYSYGLKHGSTYFFHCLSIGPRFILGGHFLIGATYNYFLRKPDFMGDVNPSWFGVSLGGAF
ncbi:MAG: hypothetical protein ACXVPU_11380 [Bacteroidia bacterium]